jgi:hypothetical protein
LEIAALKLERVTPGENGDRREVLFQRSRDQNDDGCCEV